MKSGINYAAYAKFAKQVEDQPELAKDELTRVEEHHLAVLDLYDNGFRKGLSTGWRCLDETFTVRAGEFTVITGIPGSGKSSWLDNLMINLSLAHKWRWAVFSAENYPVSRHISGLLEIYSGKPFTKGPHLRMGRLEVEQSLKWLGQYFRFLQPAEDSYSLNRLVQLAAQVEDLDAFVIDPWNELDHSRPPGMREDEHISVSLSKLRWLARNANLHVFVVAHPAKFHREKGEKKPVITLNEVKGASEWFAKADNGISVWRDEGLRDSPTEVHVQKIRFRDIGRLGKADLYYDRVTGRFLDRELSSSLHQEPREPEAMRHALSREPGDENDSLF